MSLVLYDIVSVVLLISSGITASVSDVRFSKIYNKHLRTFFVLAIAVNLLFLLFSKDINKLDVAIKITTNIVIGCIISLALYFLKIWAAGDSKLFSLFILLVPYNFYSAKSIFPGFSLLSYIFGIGFIYIVFETIFLLFLDFKKRNNPFTNFNIRKDTLSLKRITIKYITTFLTSFVINHLLSIYLSSFYINNRWLIYLINFLLIMMMLKVIKSIKAYLFVCLVGTIYIIPNVFYFRIQKNYSLTLESLIIIAVVVLIRLLGGLYNYKEIPTNQVSPGMILSFDTIILFRKSKVKGLPTFTTETTNSRLSDEEVKSIKRWEKSKTGKEYIKIVRHIPFAPFILAGTMIQVIIKVYHVLINLK